ncbi:MAG TPA: hypothetical protein VFI41_04535 [Gemmatimonadales bacterium]|nr:hypothetical protein [Gemmatimonadales bacterium]
MPFVEVSLNERSSFSPRSALVVQSELAHDVASFVVGSGVLPSSVPDGLPVSLQWGDDTGALQEFVGYVHHVEPLFSDAQPLGRFKCVCIGASWALMSGLQRSWQHQSLDTIVREVATEAFLSADVEAHSVLWPYIAANCAAWEFLLGLAAKINYTLAVNGTEVRFLSTDEVLRRSMPSAPRITTRSFRPVVGAATEIGRKSRRLGYGIDPRSGRMFSAIQGPAGAFVELDTEMTATTPEEAAAQVAARSPFVYRADAEAAGNARIRQASVVYVADVAFEYAGHWYVQQVEHDVSESNYACYFQLGKNARGAFAESKTQGFGVRVRTDPFGEVTGNPPPSILTNGVWRSSWARRAS